MAPNVREWCEQITILKWFVSRFSSQRQCFNRCFSYNYIFFLLDIRSFFNPSGKTAKQGASKVENKRGKDSIVKSLSKQNVGKSRTKNKVSNGLWSIWERKLYVLSENSTSEVTQKRSAHITAPRTVWLDRSSCVSIYSGAIHIPIYLLWGRGGNTSFRQNWYFLPYMVKFPLSWIFYLALGR